MSEGRFFLKYSSSSSVHSLKSCRIHEKITSNQFVPYVDLLHRFSTEHSLLQKNDSNSLSYCLSLLCMLNQANNTLEQFGLIYVRLTEIESVKETGITSSGYTFSFMTRAGKMAVSSKFEKWGAINLQPCKSTREGLICGYDIMNHMKKLSV